MQPLRLPPDGHDPGRAQRRQMARDLRLRDVKRLDQFADAEIPLSGHQQDGAQPQPIRQCGEYVLDAFHILYIWLNAYMLKCILRASE